MDDMAIPKAKARDAVPFAASPESVAAPSRPEGKSLTIKLKADQYQALRSYCLQEELRTGERATHQDVVVRALMTFLGR